METLPDRISLDQCRQHVKENVFRLRPADYGTKHPIWPGMVGIEVEMMPFVSSSLATNPKMIPLNGSTSLLSILKKLVSDSEGWIIRSNADGSVASIGIGDDEQLTFEPGGQLEFSTRPFPCLTDATQRVSEIQGTLNRAFEKEGVVFLQNGTHPWASAEEIGLQMAKPRYQAMDRYFTQIGPYGRRMMRETSTVQVNLDFGESEHTLANRYLASNLAASFLTAIFANSPVTSGKLNGFKTIRANIWRHLDAGRTGYPDLTKVLTRLDLDSCVDAYLDHVLSAHVVFVEALDFKVTQTPVSFRQWIAHGIDGTYPNLQDFKTHLTLHFPEVRPKGFLELRSIDCQATAWQTVPASISAALLYDPKIVTRVIDTLGSKLDQLDSFWQRSVYGLDDPEMAKICKSLLEMALEGFHRLPSCYQGKSTGKVLEVFAERFTFSGKSPADEVIQLVKKHPEKTLDSKEFLRLHEDWSQAARD